MNQSFNNRQWFELIGCLENAKRKRLKKIGELFNVFYKLQDKYCEAFKYEDAIFGYTEMSNVALLSAAAIKQGWYSACEYQTLKRSKLDARKNAYGRVDLYLCTKDKGDEYEFFCEAKQLGRYSSNLLQRKMVDDKIKEVNDDVSRTVNARGEEYPFMGLSIIFIQHYYAAGKSTALSIDEDIDFFRENILNLAEQNKVSAASYFAPSSPLEGWTETEHLIGLGVLLNLR